MTIAVADAVARRPSVRSRAWTRSVGLLAAIVLLAAVTACSLAYGAKAMPLQTVWDAFTEFDPQNNDHLIVRSLRVPRTIIGLLVGAALGLAGAVMQGVTRNPLADPALLGIEAGASLAVVAGISAFNIGSLSGYVWFAFAGAAAASAVVYGLSSFGHRGSTPLKLALAGTAVAALLSSLTSAVLLLDVTTLDQFRFWVVGSLAGRDDAIIWDVIPFIAVGAVLSVGVGSGLNTLALGDDIARGLGQRVAVIRAVSAVRRRLAVRGGDGRRWTDRLRRAHRAARRSGDLRAGLPLDPAVVDGPRADVVARRRRHRPPRGPPRRTSSRHRHGDHRGAVLHRPGPPPPPGGTMTWQCRR